MGGLRLPILGLVAALALLPIPAGAGAPTDQLRAAAEKVTQILDDPALQAEARAPERQAAVRAAVIDLLDFTEISRRALGRHWRPLTDAEREEFVALFRALLDRTYLPQIKLYQGERIQFVGESVDGDFSAVQARVATRRGQEAAVMFRLHRRDERWLIYDVSVEGISLVSNYRAQFDQIIQRASYQALVERIKQKLADSRSE
ncbi:MAG: ABC transporter substrate-binding protein [Candidatus Rokubacteria bacterium]|nr:ABC transporter substrate-binding protein [Candidatus Rokubacteria bacterium]MBI2543963.1 ABC transporter substrate-binding protein [Candidatus Rokubacteria bacterium]MBI2553124.1 ABC transporter substrate-binding protein [Candidatus Rokubacteria bacterium]